MKSFTKTTLLTLSIIAATAVSPLRADDTQDITAAVHIMTNAMRTGDVAAIVGSYASDGLLVLAPDAEFRGPEMLTAAYQEFAAINPQITFESETIWVAGAIALHIAPWTMTGTGPDGTEFTDGGLSVVAMQRLENGNWKIQIDLPHAEAPE